MKGRPRGNKKEDLTVCTVYLLRKQIEIINDIVSNGLCDCLSFSDFVRKAIQRQMYLELSLQEELITALKTFDQYQTTPELVITPKNPNEFVTLANGTTYHIKKREVPT